MRRPSKAKKGVRHPPGDNDSLSVAAIRSNLRRLVRRWRHDPTEALQRYVTSWQSADARAMRPAMNEPGGPVWLLLPEWLAGMYNADRRYRAGDRTFLKDVLWAQFAVFLAIKIQDDLFDEQLADRSTLWLADEFLLEAQRVFTVHLAGSKRFWDFYTKALRTTVRAIARVDHIQSGCTPEYQAMARLYPSMYAVCKLATKAICLREGKPDDFQKASHFLDEMALTGQVLDDLEDMREDLQRGRMNAAAVFLAPRAKSHRKKRVRGLGSTRIKSDAIPELFQSLYLHLQRAEKAVQFLENPELTRFLQLYGESLRALQVRFILP